MSSEFVTTLNLQPIPYPTPYKINWIKKGGEAQVSNIRTILLSIGNNYKDQIICDVLEMDVCYIILGRPW